MDITPEIIKATGLVVNAVIESEAHKATKYMSEKMVVNATRRMYLGKIVKGDRSIDISLKIGVPNYLEKEFIKQCKKAGEPFPVKKIQLKFPVKKKK